MMDSTIVNTLATLARADYQLIGWKRELCPPGIEGGVCFRYAGNGLLVLAGLESVGERLWLHVSTSLPDRYPTWEELRAVKDGFVGPNRHAVQHLPRVDEHVSVHPNCFHLWSIVEGEDPFDEVSGRL